MPRGLIHAFASSVRCMFIPFQEYLSLRQRLAEVFMPTEELISRYYELEEQAVCNTWRRGIVYGGTETLAGRNRLQHQAVITGGKGGSADDDVSGRMEAVLTYDSARDTLVVFCMSLMYHL